MTTISEIAKEVRDSVCLAVDRQQLIEAVGGERATSGNLNDIVGQLRREGIALGSTFPLKQSAKEDTDKFVVLYDEKGVTSLFRLVDYLRGEKGNYYHVCELQRAVEAAAGKAVLSQNEDSARRVHLP